MGAHLNFASSSSELFHVAPDRRELPEALLPASLPVLDAMLCERTGDTERECRLCPCYVNDRATG